jgi:hypothetical protein
MYSKLISTAEPGCVLLLIDQSSSMSDPFGGVPGSSKAEECAKAVNRVIREVVISCSSGETIKPRCYVGVIGYGGSGTRSIFGGALAGRQLVRVDEVGAAPLGVRSIQQKVPDGAGGLVEQTVPFPYWIGATADGGTPMQDAFSMARTTLQTWISEHGSSFPPVVINVTDGEPNEAESARAQAHALLELRTGDGPVLLLNAHISTVAGRPICLPGSEQGLPDQFAKFLFGLSSVLPDSLRASARAQGFVVETGSRGFLYNADAEALIRLLAFGSNPTGAR